MLQKSNEKHLTDFRFTNTSPKNFRSHLPSIEEAENELIKKLQQ